MTMLDDIALAHHLADAAGAAILPYFRRLEIVDIKADATPVTVADRAAERAMRAIVAEERPDDGISGEEFDGVATRNGRVWVLDPIDGTKAFTAGKPTFTALIALYVDGSPALGIIDQPYLRERWTGDGRSAAMNGRPLRSRRGVPLARAVLSSTAPELFASNADREAFARVQDAVAYVSWGGDAYGFALLAAGCVDIVVEMGHKTVDYGPLPAIVGGAGGVVSDWQGRPLTLESEGRILAAGDPALHAATLALLAG